MRQERRRSKIEGLGVKLLLLNGEVKWAAEIQVNLRRKVWGGLDVNCTFHLPDLLSLQVH